MDCNPHLHLAAYHDSSYAYNNDTLGAGALCVLDPDYTLIAGTYYNSLRRTTVYAALAWQPLQWGPVRLGGMAGTVSGYQDGLIPMGAGVLSVQTGKLHWHFTMVPKVVNISPTTLELSVSYNFR